MKHVITIAKTTHQVELPEPLIDGVPFTLTVDGKPHQAVWRANVAALAFIDTQGVEHNLQLRGWRVSRFDGDTETRLDANVHVGAGKMTNLKATSAPDLPGQKQAAGAGQTMRVIRSQITGKILKVMVKVGDIVKTGDTLLLIEAMKMENRVFAPAPGRVSAIAGKDGDSVATGKELLRMDGL